MRGALLASALLELVRTDYSADLLGCRLVLRPACSVLMVWLILIAAVGFLLWKLGAQASKRRLLCRRPRPHAPPR